MIDKLIRERRSVRTYDARPLTPDDLQKLREQIDQIDNPYQIPVGFKLLDAKEHGLSSPVLCGDTLYVGGRIIPCEHWNEAFGYAFEKLILAAQSLGLGTVWIGGTMNRAIFEQAMDLARWRSHALCDPRRLHRCKDVHPRRADAQGREG